MKKKRLFKNNTQMVIYIILYIICIVLFIAIGKANFTKNKESDAVRFSSLYNLVGDDNLYKFINASGVINILNGRSGVILMGFPTNKWTNYYAYLLNEVAKEVNIEELYYYDFLNDRENNNGTYETIVNKLRVYVPVDDENNKDIIAPVVLIVKNGDVLAYFDDTATMRGTVTPEVYYTLNQETVTKEKFKTALIEYNK